MVTKPKISALEALLEASAATAEFKQAIRAFEKGQDNDRIRFNPGAPAVKILRVIAKFLEERPNLAVHSIAVSGTSGCSDFAGTLTVEPGAKKFDFVWDCKWRAEQMGWTDPLGMPDQIRAAREFGYQCFEKFAEARS